ncbi:tyrosine-sulfated glycopeptide receptor 1-like [Phragmites australis]|uniref:tyrosine-sulfated glycopeptide receptor 1-like n=1 Tax=Phragmites australis TaxID=29695 RepID=UPI002D76F76D|nr:tyrosine-sulfated glycopeptide receptor 1-like [Phragmites australis]
MQQQLHSSCKKYSNGFPIPFLGLSLALLLFAFLQPTSSCTEQEKSCLLQFLAGLSQDGGLALSWQNGTHCCTWEGVACGANGTVTDVSLTSKGLEGHISASLGELTGLLRINLSHNMLSGGLPLELMSSNSIVVLDVSFNRLNGDLRQLPSSTPGRPLQVFNISSNLFTGQFPSKTWEVMNSLVALNASNNSFTGQIPSHFCSSSPALTVIALCYNQLSGSIPPELGNCSMLKVLKAGHNNLTGPLPGELFSATSLEYLSFPNNGLQGILDGARIVNLRNLANLDLGGNKLNGNIPDSIGQLKRLEELHLDHNSMSGELPSTLSNCTNLITIDLKGNNFSGELQKVNFFNLPNLKTLDLLYNNFAGTIPESIYSCGNLIALRLSSNNLHGQLSPRIGNLKSLTFLSLASNNFTNITNTLQILKNCRNLTSLLIGTNFKGEAMPQDETIDGFENLQVLVISNCSLSGKIPLWISKLKNLQISCTEQENGSLLQFLAGLSQDGGLTKSWQNGTDCCTWEGISCSPDRTVTDVFLASRSLQGFISPFLGNLTGLLRLNLSYNFLSGGLPLELVSSRSIIVLDVSFNQLSGELQDLPSSTPVRSLQVLNISSNLFTGRFPSTTWETMKSLAALNASNNSFIGQIPTAFCVSAPSFSVLELSYNQFSGSISPGLGNCSMLTSLSAGHNNLSGDLPDELFKITLLGHLSFPNNRLGGSLGGISKLTNLVTLDLGGNWLRGNIPDSIGQLKRLEEIHLDHNNMSGELPSTLSNCISLVTIDLKNNTFSGELTSFNFSTLTNLKTLDLAWNNFTGTIPEGIYTCSKLTALRLSKNRFHGRLSERISNLKSLSFLSLVDNSITNITSALQILRSCRNLTTLLIGHNFMHETMPEDYRIDGFENLQVLSINDCSLSGKIPLWLLKLTNLELLFLYNNQLTGSIPDWMSSLSFLFYIDISNNSLTGEIPTALMEMPMLKTDKVAPNVFELPVYTTPSLQYRMPSAFPKVLNIGNNNLTGVIPKQIGQLKALISLNLSFNRLSGEIPQPICNLTNLQQLDLSSNDLTGMIPDALNDLHFLSRFNVSNNDLEGPIPTVGQLSTFPNSSFSGNPKLCGSVLVNHCGSAKTALVSKKRHNKRIIFVIAFGVFFGGIAILFLLARLLFFLRSTNVITRNRSNSKYVIEAMSSNFNSEQSLVMVPRGKGEQNKLKFTDIVKATDNFDKENIIGCGGYGLVYKAELPDGSKVAIKKLNSEMCLMDKEFSAEVDALSMAQHDNLVPLWGYCIQGNSRFLIYSYMENGSLDDWLHNRDDDAGTLLDWPRRLKIAQGASRGLSHIHDVCKPPIVHRDIKSSNILLDKEFKAYIADFGLSRLILPNKTHVTTELVGTLGYIPPEYGQGSVATLRGDMYSFGVVLLELLTGRRPVLILSTSKELIQWVQEMRSEGKQIEVLDPALRGTGYEEQMLKVLETACQCVNHNRSMRPTIQEVVSCLDSVDANLKMQNSVKIEQCI